jgi:hypothetical protein
VELGEDVTAFESQVDAAIAGSSPAPGMSGSRSHDHFGFHSPESLEGFRAALMSWRLGSVETPRSSATFTDATLIYTAHAATRSGTFSPFALLDLATLVRSIVLYDHVFSIANPAIDDYALNESMGDRVLIPYREAISATASASCAVTPSRSWKI